MSYRTFIAHEVADSMRVGYPSNTALYRYSYDNNGNLSSVIYPDGKRRTYHYNEPANINNGTACSSGALPRALTGITDENGHRFATYKYSCNGKAISTERAGGADKYTFAYPSSVTTTEIDPLNTTRTHQYSTLLNVARRTSTTQPAASGSGTVQESFTFDGNGNVATRKDFNGNRTNYTYDLTRNLETRRVEGLTSTGGTTAQTRTISTQWHPLYRLPTQITEPGRVTALSYDPNGNLLSKTVTAGTKTRTWAYTYNTLGQVLTANGPRTDVSDVTAFTYDAQGNVATITNALGHVTQITHYDAHGHGAER